MTTKNQKWPVKGQIDFPDKKNMQKLEAFFTHMRQEKGMEGSSKVGFKEGPGYTMEMW